MSKTGTRVLEELEKYQVESVEELQEILDEQQDEE